MKNLLFAFVALMGLSSIAQAGDFSGCKAEVNGWGLCVGEITVTPEALVVKVRQDGETNLWTGFVNAPPQDFGCEPLWYSFAFHSNVNGWGADGTWHTLRLPMTVFGNNYPAKGYFEALAYCKDKTTKHQMPFNMAYWVIRDVKGTSPRIDPESGLWIFGDYRDSSVQVLDGNTVRLDFGTNKVYNVADSDGLIVPMDYRNISSCGFLRWNPDYNYTAGYIYTVEDGTVVADIPNFPFGEKGYLVCKGPGDGDIYLAVDRWGFPEGTWFDGGDGNAYVIPAPPQ